MLKIQHESHAEAMPKRMRSNLHTAGLHYFIEIARAGSLKAASDALHVDVSALSRQISKLEQDLQCVLFERTSRGMVLSEAGPKTSALRGKDHVGGGTERK